MPPELHTGENGSSEARPLLTIAIPTFNRAEQLRDLLAILQPQVARAEDVGSLSPTTAAMTGRPP